MPRFPREKRTKPLTVAQLQQEAIAIFGEEKAWELAHARGSISRRHTWREVIRSKEKR